ncbi:hypothetical protein [Actinokineospora bangkokensis]|uniref:hypothetical protein n=1 Tax=Actinokineospora bangkokensis TaxID=1193682 RepID=UPI000ACB3AC0|nr:hypothetical protein [Actinokineospora bangkokensis]
MQLLHPRALRELTPGCPPWQSLASLIVLAATTVALVVLGVAAQDTVLLLAVLGGLTLADRGVLSTLARGAMRALATGSAS